MLGVCIAAVAACIVQSTRCDAFRACVMQPTITSQNNPWTPSWLQAIAVIQLRQLSSDKQLNRSRLAGDEPSETRSESIDCNLESDGQDVKSP